MKNYAFTVYTLYIKGNLKQEFFYEMLNSVEKQQPLYHFFFISFFIQKKQTKMWTILRGPSRHKKSREQFGFFFESSKITFSQIFFKKNFLFIQKIFRWAIFTFFYQLIVGFLPMSACVYFNIQRRCIIKTENTFSYLRKLKLFE